MFPHASSASFAPAGWPSVWMAAKGEDAMTADITLDRQAAIAERRTAYEADVIHALLDEDSGEREERLELVRLTHSMILRALQLEDEPVEN
jgi:hypothetical protein